MIKWEFGNKPVSEEKERKKNRESGNVEVQIMEEYVFIAQLQIQKEEEEA